VLALSPTDGKIKWGFQYTPNDPYDFDEISEHPIINGKVNGEDRKMVVHAARNGFYYALDRVNGSFLFGKQYVDQQTWTTGLDPKTGKPLNYDPTKDVQVYTPGSHGMRGQGPSKTCTSHSGGKNWPPSAYNPELNLLYLPTIEGCDSITTVEQKSFIDQGGTVKARERFTGGTTSRLPDAKRYGAVKAVDPLTGETKAQFRVQYPNYGGMLTTAGNLVFNGGTDGTFHALDARTLKELWSFNVGSSINAPPIAYSVNGKQYIAVLVGSKQSAQTLAEFPELKNTSASSMLYVFGL
jgi:alcohol dehydrogenase (cytochrome c)